MVKNDLPLPYHGFAGIFSGMIILFLVAPLFIHTYMGMLVMQACLSIVLLGTVYLVCHHRKSLLLGLAFLTPFWILDFFAIRMDSLHLMSGAYIFYSAFILFAIIYLGKNVIYKQEIDSNLIFGVITVYILAGILFAKLYFLQDFMFPDSFTGIPLMEFKGNNLQIASENQFNFLYYSFTTLSTLGLGDIAPKHHFARSLTVIESVFGQLFVATVVSKMVSMWKKR